MNRRNFIQSVGKASVALPVTSSILASEILETLPAPTNNPTWQFYVECYIRQQKEWAFTEYVKNSFAPEREYMTFEEEKEFTGGWCGWMDQGRLHFNTLDDAVDFIESHVRVANFNGDDSLFPNDIIYEVYYKGGLAAAHEPHPHQHVGHFWYNGDTGKNIYWRQQNPINKNA